MRAILVGGGNLGSSIAELLIREEYDVTVIESEEENIAPLEEKLDARVMHGNGASIAVLQSAGIAEASLLLAMTASDEVNIVTCLLGKQAGAEYAVARVSNIEYLTTRNAGGSFLSDIDLLINPEWISAREIATLIEVPEALDVMYFAERKAMMLELPITGNSPVKGRSMKQMNPESPYLIAAIVRGNKAIIPRGEDKILEGDVVYLLAQTSEMARIEHFLGMRREEATSLMILGGGRTGRYLARFLEEKNYTVKMIEKDYRRCEALSEELSHTLVIHGDATDLDLLKQEGAGRADVFICVTDDDKENLLLAVIAKHLGAKRTIAMIRRSEYVNIMEGVGIDIGVSQKALAVGAIYRFIKRSANLLSFTYLQDEEASMLEFIVPPACKIANRKLMDIHFPLNAIIGSILRDGEVRIAKGNDMLKPNDRITVICLPKAINQVIALLS
ncbi:MAG: Trk system potassium transporter TrkA [Clostridiales bacterium]|nr:Trk system potassium transporter TrkA [Clostridiales bacterium]